MQRRENAGGDDGGAADGKRERAWAPTRENDRHVKITCGRLENLKFRSEITRCSKRPRTRRNGRGDTDVQASPKLSELEHRHGYVHTGDHMVPRCGLAMAATRARPRSLPSAARRKLERAAGARRCPLCCRQELPRAVVAGSLQAAPVILIWPLRFSGATLYQTTPLDFSGELIGGERQGPPSGLEPFLEPHSSCTN